MKLQISKYLNNGEHDDEQINVFETHDGTTVVILADGVSTCTSGRIAASFLCYYIEEYATTIQKESIAETGFSRFCKDAITYSVSKIKEFATEIIDITTKKHDKSDQLRLLLDELKQVFSSEELENIQREWIESPETCKLKGLVDSLYGFGLTINNNTITDYTIETIREFIEKSTYDVFFKLEPERYKEIQKEIFNKIISSIRENQKPSFKSTLALATLYPSKSAEHYNLTTASLGDPEIYIFTLDDKHRTETIIPHFKIQEGPNVLTNYIGGDSGVVGRIDVASREFFLNDVVVIGSDGSNLKFTTGGGFQYVFLKNHIEKNFNKEFENISEKWYSTLKGKGAISDDYSAIFIRAES